MIKTILLIILISIIYVGCSKNTLHATDFTIRVIGGGGDDWWYDKTITLSKLRGRPVVIHFTASWCNFCKEIFNTVTTNNRDAFVMGIGVLDRKIDFIDHIRAMDLPVPVGYDEDGFITKNYGVKTLPLTIFIDREGRIVERVHGVVSKGRLEDIIRKI